MQPPFGKPGVSRFIFALLLLAFNWPLLSIPARPSLLGWLFVLWGLTIVLLFLAARWNGFRDSGAEGDGADLPGTQPPRPLPPEAPGADAEGGGV